MEHIVVVRPNNFGLSSSSFYLLSSIRFAQHAQFQIANDAEITGWHLVCDYATHI